MPDAIVGGSSMSDAQGWARTLAGQIDGGEYAADRDGWLDGIDVDDARATAMGWAADSNAFVCSAVVPEGQAAVEGAELDGEYLDEATPVIELQIARGMFLWPAMRLPVTLVFLFFLFTFLFICFSWFCYWFCYCVLTST